MTYFSPSVWRHLPTVCYSLKNTKTIYKNSNSISIPKVERKFRPIVVDEETNELLSNGLIDVNRDIVMRLIALIADKKKIRNIIGMNSTFYSWSRQRIFRWASSLLFTFLPNDYIKGVIITKKKFTFTLFISLTFFIDKEISKGIWMGEFEASGTNYGNGHLFGLACKNAIPELKDKYLGYNFGSCSFAYDHAYVGTRYLGISKLFPPRGKNTITLELNANTQPKTLHVFVNGVQKPYCITNVPGSVYMGFTGCKGTIVEARGLRRLVTSLVDPSLNTEACPWQ